MHRRTDDGRVTVWDIATEKHWIMWQAHDATLLAAQFVDLPSYCTTSGVVPMQAAMTHGRDGDLCLWTLPAFWNTTGTEELEALAKAMPPTRVWSISAGIGSYCSMAEAEATHALRVLVPGGSKGNACLAMLTATDAHAASEASSGGDLIDCSARLLDVDMMGHELLRATEQASADLLRTGCIAFPMTQHSQDSTQTSAVRLDAVYDGEPGEGGAADAGLGADGLPTRSGMLMACCWAPMGNTPASAEIGGGARASSDCPSLSAVCGFDSGRVVMLPSAAPRWEEERPERLGPEQPGLPEQRALCTVLHPSLHPVTALAAAASGRLLAVGTASDVLMLIKVTWASVVATRQVKHPPPPARVAAAAAVSSGLGAALGRSAAPTASLQYACVRKPSMELAAAVRLPRAGVSSVAVAEESGAVVMAGWDGRIRVFECSKLMPQLACLEFHRLSAYALTVAKQHGSSGDFALTLASGDKEGRIALWELPLLPRGE